MSLFSDLRLCINLAKLLSKYKIEVVLQLFKFNSAKPSRRNTNFGPIHLVDFSDMAFQTAAGIAYKDGLPTAAPTLLEPIAELKVMIPDTNMGDIIVDLNKRRGRVMGMNPDPKNTGWQIVEAEVPMGKMSSYSIDLRSMTQGRGAYTMKFVRYEEVPQMNQAKIIEDAKKEDDE